MVKKGIATWILGFLTLLAGLHALDGFLWMVNVQNDSLFLALYPFSGAARSVSPELYFFCMLAAVFFLWGGTAVVAVRNPIESFLAKVLEDGKRENQADVELLETRTSILEMMSGTLENNSKLLAGLRDVVFNIRSEVLSIEPMRRKVGELKGDVDSLRKTLKHLEREIKKSKLCPACGREVLTKFRLCPYCGEILLKPPTNGEIPILAPLPTLRGKGK
ncbi:MAG: hypothetical protein JSV51_06615 [Candidatus Bathyarchaeota archaeon]|nr:MAG: hypothetical protein JSV51_06615 [Candidatus Bathyarchaeota archaeon]